MPSKYLSFKSENNINEDIIKELPKNPYITKDHIPEIEIINENTMTCDKKNMTSKIRLILLISIRIQMIFWTILYIIIVESAK